jgi:hypothetical protein
VLIRGLFAERYGHVALQRAKKHFDVSIYEDSAAAALSRSFSGRNSSSGQGLTTKFNSE